MSPFEDGDDLAELLANLRSFLFADEKWMQQAQCRLEGVPTKEFFPVRGTSQKTARACCARCPVATECLDYADRSDTQWGIWGGEIRTREQWPQAGEDYWDEFGEIAPAKQELTLDQLD